MPRDITDLRQEYSYAGLQEADIDTDPIRQFERWFDDAVGQNIAMPNAMVLATADRSAKPGARYVLLKEFDENGFIFYTSSLSQKGRQLAENPLASLVFYWSVLHRQVRIDGTVELLPAQKADEYFCSRPRGSRISVWVAEQSSSVPDRDFMLDKIENLERQFADREIPRPDAWIGYRVRPLAIEFWQGQENRLHDRILYQRDAHGDWAISRLAP